jgi:hypothetical protein
VAVKCAGGWKKSLEMSEVIKYLESILSAEILPIDPIT